MCDGWIDREFGDRHCGTRPSLFARGLQPSTVSHRILVKGFVNAERTIAGARETSGCAMIANIDVPWCPAQRVFVYLLGAMHDAGGRDLSVAAGQAYATITSFLYSQGVAWRLKCRRLERPLEVMRWGLIRKLLRAHLDLRQSGGGKSRFRVPPPPHACPPRRISATGKASSGRWRLPVRAIEA